MGEESGNSAGYSRIPNIVITEYLSRIGAYAFAIYGILAKHADQNRCCYPSVSTLQNLSGFSRPTVCKAIEVLKQWELVGIEVGKRGAFIYTLLEPKPIQLVNVLNQSPVNQLNQLNGPLVNVVNQSLVNQLNQLGEPLVNQLNRSGKRGKPLTGKPAKPKQEPIEQEPTNNNQPTPLRGELTLALTEPAEPPQKARRSAPQEKQEAKTTATFDAFNAAYTYRYGAPHIRNREVNGILSRFIDRIGAEEAPAVAAYYVSSRNRYYVERGHSVKCLLADAEKLRTEWATGRQTMNHAAIEQDRMQNTVDMAGRIKSRIEAREHSKREHESG